ncbi:ABC transporter substrate-binding protein [Hoyosella subflava]|uniref:Putative secreted protein n=1 Tax=Hoyosella subflava (strain DSM 45089 / JCM 17490 / NBRC 109087 / DQS3-9A1) TaxID=443218 RepID=F6EK51_HOYSD|nr:ABC transporter substrate-binding protein [Hoyosella subflava]AEF42592.1 Putative secreted protein [Hoyosella subflava DQS3-9A1]
MAAKQIGRTLATVAVAAVMTLAGCSAPSPDAPEPAETTWTEVEEAAVGQTVSLWMWGGDEQGNRYVDSVLAPAAAEAGVTLRRVPVADTGEAVNRILAERQAGITDGDVDLVWVNGDNFATGKQAGAWLCNWTDQLPNMQYTDPDDPLLLSDFGTPVDGCEAPWHKAQFTLVYDEASIPEPPATLEGVLQWAKDNPGRFTYPAPPDFTGSVFIREVLTRVADDVPLEYSDEAYEQHSAPLFDTLNDLAPSLWRAGRTYPQTVEELNQLFADGQVDMMMTYGPATLTDLVGRGTFPDTTRVLLLDEGTVGNASFLAVPSTSGNSAGARVVANIALSPQQQLEKAKPDVWGQFTVLDSDRLNDEDRASFDALPESPVVPTYEELSRNARPELATAWVPALDEGWRRTVLAGR